MITILNNSIRPLKSTCFLFLVGLILFFSCRNNKKVGTQQNEDVQVSIALDTMYIEELEIANDISEYSLTFLQSAPEYSIGEVNKLMFCNDKLIIYDRMQKKIFIFNNDGTFHSKIDNIGKGPDEYIQINDFCVSEDTKSIFVTVVGGGRGCKVYEYDLNGEIINSFNIPFIAYNIQSWDSNLAFYTDYTTKLREDFNVYITTTGGEIIGKHFPYKARSGGWGQGLSSRVFSYNDGQLFYYPLYSDTVYRFISSRITEPYLLLRGKNPSGMQQLKDLYQDISMDEFVAYKEQLDVWDFTELVMCYKYMYFSAGHGNVEERYVYDLDNGRLKLLKQGDYMSLVLASPLLTDSTLLVNIINPYEIHSFVNKYKERMSVKSWNNFVNSNRVFMEIYENSSFNDNPVIIKYKFDETWE